MLRDSLIAAIRTGVAALAGLLVTYLIALGVDLPEDFAANFTAVVFILATAGYNFAVGFLERKVNPLFGVLLGVPKAPAYGSVGTKTPGGATPAAVDEALDYVSPETPASPPLARGEEGNTSLIGLGAAVLLIGLLVSWLTRLDGLGYVTMVVGAVVAIVGVIMLLLGRGDRAL